MFPLSDKEKEILAYFTRSKECSVIRDILTRRLEETKTTLVKTGLDMIPCLQGKARELEELIKLFTIKN